MSDLNKRQWEIIGPSADWEGGNVVAGPMLGVGERVIVTEKPLVFTQVYSYKGKRYEVLGFGEFKHPDSGGWIKSVIYREEGDATKRIYLRESIEFMDRFIFVESREVK